MVQAKGGPLRFTGALRLVAVLVAAYRR